MTLVATLVSPHTVLNMSSDLYSSALGDVIALPDSRKGVVRCVVRRLGVTVGPMSGFVLVGEISPQAALLSIPGSPTDNVVVYAAQSSVPPHAKNASVVTEGVATYFPPHTVGVSGAMAEVAYKVAKVPGQIEPMVLMWRGPELVVFTRSFEASLDRFLLKQLAKDSFVTERGVDRVTSTVTSPVSAPASAPVRENTRSL